MTVFVGSYLHQLDEKGRLALPAPFRRSSEGSGFVLIYSHETALSLYPAQTWANVAEELDEFWRKNPDKRDHARARLADMAVADPDAQGRILIPARLQRVAELEREVLILGALTKIELWNPEMFERVRAEADTEFDQLARRIFI